MGVLFMNKKPRISLVVVIAALLVLFNFGCATTIPPEALKWTPEALKERQLQIRRFETNDETLILQGVAGLLQDLGFNIDESETKLGVIVASKDRDATDAGQVTLAIAVALLGGGVMPVDDNQKLRASVITSPATDQNSIIVRVTFQRIVWNTQGRVTKSEPLKDPQQYQEFFEKLSKSVFLEAHEI
jgi:hypothetical protein